MNKTNPHIDTHSLSQTPKNSKLTQKAYLNALSSFLDYGVRIIVTLFITPILVAGLGNNLFGIWQILNRLVSYMTAADGRPTQALKWVIANNQQSDDITIKRRAVGSALGTWLLMLPFLLAIGLILVWLAPTLTKVNEDIATSVRLASLLLIVNLVLDGLTQIPESVLRGMNLGYKRMGLMASLNVLGGLLTVGAIYFKWPLVGLAFANVLLTIITGVLVWMIVKAYIPWFGVAWVSLQDVLGFFRLSFWYSAWNLVNKLLISSDIVILGWIVSASVVTNYTLTNYLANMVISIVTMMVSAALPGLGGLIGEKKYKQVVKVHEELLWISCFLSATIGSIILLWNRAFITLWVGGEHYAGTWVNFLLVIIAVQLLFIRNEAYVIDLTLNVQSKVIAGVSSALISIVLALLLVPELGMIGLCFAIILGRSLLTVLYPSITGKFFGVSLSAQLKVIVRPISTLVILFVISAYIGQLVSVGSWIILGLYAGLSLPVVGLAQFWIGFSPEQRQRLLERGLRLKLLPIKKFPNH